MALKAAVHIETALRAGRTVVSRSFCDAPFKIADVTEDKRSAALRLMLMCSSPGVLDSDEYNFNIRLAQGTSLALQTQSYQRIFQMKAGASQGMNVQLESGASFVYLPHPSVPHKDAVFKNRNRIHLADDCTLVWGEIISCGRKLNDEVFAFTSYHSLTEIFLHGKLVVKENLFIEPMKMNVGGIGQMEGYTHQATFIYLNEKMIANEWADEAFQFLEVQENICFGISALPVKGLIVRLLGHKAEQLFQLLNRLHALIEAFDHSIIMKAKAND